MRFLADQDIYQTTVDFLRGMGHEVVTAKEAGLQQAPDKELLQVALETRRILLTRDKDFGALTFVAARSTKGVILLRFDPGTVEAVHQELARFLTLHKDVDLTNRFVVVEPGRHRIRTIRRS